jgi:uncharacterized protein (TIGR03435 family)
MRITPTSLWIEGMKLTDLIAVAYETKADRLNGPDWMEDVTLDIEAKTEGPVSESTIHSMLRDLLAERMGLRAHRQAIETDVYILSTNRRGVKLKESNEKTMQPFRSERVAGGRSFESSAMSIPRLCVLLGSNLDLPLLDRTGLGDSLFEVNIIITNEDLRTNARAYFAKKDPGSQRLALQLDYPMFDAVTAMGLHLERGKGPVEFIVVDQVLKRPTDGE